jgi:glycosyltransferase involved in cell wall biosynthesis
VAVSGARTHPPGRPLRLAYLVSHPIQYQAPLLARIAREPDIALTVFFESSLSVAGYHDTGFGRQVAWDTPLLEGYDHAFLPTLGDGRRRGPLWPWPYGLIRRLRRGGFDALWIHGYSPPHHQTAILAAKALGIPVLVRDEVWARGMARRPGLRSLLRRATVGWQVRAVDAWLTIGRVNAEHLRSWGVPDERLFPMPYAVDNARFAASAAAADTRALRRELGIGERPVALFVGKLMPRKRVLDAVEAMARLDGPAAARRPVLLIAGDGEQYGAAERAVADRGLQDSVRLLGFRNQSEMPGLYALAEVLLIPSAHEQWGLVVNEAMAAGTAILASEEVGAAYDLVAAGATGHVVPVGDVAAMAGRLGEILKDGAGAAAMGAAARARVATWDFEADVAGLRAALARVCPGRLPPAEAGA